MKATVEVTYPTRHEDGLSEDLPEWTIIPEYNRYFTQKADEHNAWYNKAIHATEYCERWPYDWENDGYCMEFEFDTISGAKAFIKDIETEFGCPPCFTQEIERIKQ